MKILILLFAFTLIIFSVSKAQNIGIFDNNYDIGNPKLKGSSSFNAINKSYTLNGAGYNIWFNRDEFQYLYKSIKGDFTLTANFAFEKPTGNNHRKYGWMIRESIKDDAAHVSAVAHGDGLTVMQWRVKEGAQMRDPEDEIFYPKKALHQTIQLKRKGKNITMSVANNGEKFDKVGSYNAAEMPDKVLVGLYVCSHDSTDIQKVKVWNVKIKN